LTYTVLARRYRSVSFDDIVGQDSIAHTLQNAISNDRTAHAYLFCGTRGVGKTSMARIFARALNLSDDLQERDAIGQAILRGNDLDVIEIDGASNRGVQEARDLIAASGLSPTRCQYRIYIIDEVHMLTTPAFNALLKTMEEPPSHVKFILCTTEPHKVPATIQSRCQRFDFRTIPSPQIASHLTYVLEQEGVEADPEVVAEVARLGNGSMRDALSILDRLLAGGSKKIEIDEMEELLGLPSQTAVNNLCNAIAGSNMQNAFEAADALIASGVALDRVLEVVATSLRHALIARVCGDESRLLELSDEARTQAAHVGSQFDEPTISHLIALCDAASRQVRRGGTGRALFDATIARLCMTGEICEAGNVLTSGQATRTKTKKKRGMTNSPSPDSTTLQQPISTTQVDSKVKEDVTWESMQSTLASTAGLKKIATHLTLKSFSHNHLVLTIGESGLESSKYILAQQARIEEVLSIHASRRINVEISTTSNIETPCDQSSIFDEVKGHDLVQTAQHLFDGTVVNVKSTNKERN